MREKMHAFPSNGNLPDLIVIGAGVIGSAIAYELSLRGRRTLNLDALPAAGYGSTSCSSAIVRFSYSTPTGVSMAWEALHYWQHWGDYLQHEDGPLAELITCGMAVLDTGSGLASRVRPLFEQLGIPHEQWDRPTLQQEMPLLDTMLMGPPTPIDSDEFWAEPTQPLVGALWMPDAGYENDPQLAARNLQRAAQTHGAEFRFNTRVVEVQRDGDRVTGVTLADGSSIAAPIVINVAGPDSGRVNDLAGLGGTMAISTRPMRQEVHHLPSPLGSDGQPLNHLIADDDTGIYVKPEAGGMLAIGSMEPACDELEWIESPDDYAPRVSAEGWERQTLRLARRIPDLAIPNRPLGIVGIYDVADDWIPIYDRTDLDGFYVAIGSSGNQFKNAPFAAHAMAELIGAVENGQDHDHDPVRVVGQYTGAEIDLGFFSRNREINRNSSFTVCG